MKHFILFFFLLIYSLGFSAELRIGEIQFEGNFAVEKEELKKTIYSKNGGLYNQQIINEDAERISKLYNKKSILNVKILQPQIITKDPQHIDIIFIIQEKEEPVISKFFLTGNRYLSLEKISSEVNLNNVPLANLAKTMQELVNFYTRNGFLFASLQIDSLRQSKSFYQVYITIEEGDFCEFDEYKFRGNKVTKQNTILKISQIASLPRITPFFLDAAAEKLRRKDYIKTCEIIPLNGKQALFLIEEDRMSLISGILGYDNSKPKNKFTGFINVDFLNLYGTDRAMSIFWKSLGEEGSSIQLDYHESGPLKYPIAADFSLNRTEVDSTYISTQFNTDVYYQDINSKYGIYFGLEDIFPGSRRPKLIAENSLQKIGALWEISKVDNFRNPSSGHENDLRYYYIFSKKNNNSVSKQAVELEVNYYQHLGTKIVLAAGMMAKVIENKELSEYELFKLGGHNNLRGFTEDQFSGYRITCTSLELRLLTSYDSRLFLFTDHGYVQSQDYRFNDLFGFGLGMNLRTKLGILAITYAFSYQNEELRNPLDGIIHFGIESKL